MAGLLDGKTAIVTGAGRGIGRAVALRFARDGAHVLATSVSGGNGLEDEAAAFGGRIVYQEADVGDEKQIMSLFEKAHSLFDRLDIAVNNAGIIDHKPLLETDVDDFDKVIRINLRGMFLTGREAIRFMDRHDAGRVINMASDLSYLGRPEFSAYCASKFGAMALTRCWALEFAPRILVNAVCPGPIDTDMLSLDNISPEWREKEKDVPLRRFGEVEEVAALTAFLAGPEASYITGQGFGVNGGSVMP